MSGTARFWIAAGLVLAGVLVFEGLRQATKDRSLAIDRSDMLASSPVKPERADGPSAPRAQWFKDITDQVHLDFVQAVGPLGTYFMPEINGSGGALLDYDNDGDLDLFLVNLGKSPKATKEFASNINLSHRMYRQESDGRFSDQTTQLSLANTQRTDIPQLGIGTAVGDVNNDGFVDLYLTNYGPDQLFLNQSGETFRDVSEAAGLGCPEWGHCCGNVRL